MLLTNATVRCLLVTEFASRFKLPTSLTYAILALNFILGWTTVLAHLHSKITQITIQMQRTCVLVHTDNKLNVVTITLQRTHTPGYTRTEMNVLIPPHAVTQVNLRPAHNFGASNRESLINNTALKNVNGTHLNESICHQMNFQSSKSSRSVTDNSLLK
jgi:hypothetical protein